MTYHTPAQAAETTYEQSGYLDRKFRQEQECRYERMPDWWWDAAARDLVFQSWARGFLAGRTPLEAEIEETRAAVDLYRENVKKAEALHAESGSPAERRHAQHDVDFNKRWFTHYRAQLDELLLEQTRTCSAPRTAVLHLESWAGRESHPVDIVAETPERYRVRARDVLRLPGPRYKKAGEEFLVPKSAITFEAAG